VARTVLLHDDVPNLRAVIVVALVSACGFSPTPLQVQIDAQGSAELGSPDAAGATEFAACHSQLSGLVLCFDFEDPSFAPTVHDSSPGDHDAITANVDMMARAQQHAAMVDQASSITVPEATELDVVGAVSVEMWLEATTAQQDVTVFSHSADYGIDFNFGTGCYIGNAEAWAPDTLPVGWHHIGCTFDGATIAAYVDGSLVACAPGHSALAAHAAEIGIGERFSGGIDDVHVYHRALASTEIQGLAGVTTGATTCPSPFLGGAGGP
jgi:hypothetical protein